MNSFLIALALPFTALASQWQGTVSTDTMAEPTAPTIAGDWWGTLQVGSQALRLITSFEGPDDDGVFQGKVISVDQGAVELALTNVEVGATTLRFDVPQIGGSYEAKWENDGWVGTWSQGNMSLPLNLERGKPENVDLTPAIPADWALPDNEEVAARLAKAVGEQDGVVGAVALVEDGTPRFVLSDGLDAERRFEIGSVTKVFTALLLADMVLDGSVGLDDPIGTYIDAIDNEAVAAITLRQLSNHHSGLPRLPANLMPFAQLPDPYAVYDDEMLLHWIHSVEPARAPGEAYEYSNGATGLLGYILGRAAGSNYMTAMTERIVGPMGLSDTDFALDDRSISGHDAQGATSPWTFQALAGAGALRSTIGDMARFANILAAPPERWQDHVDLITADQTSVQGGMTIGLGVLTIPITPGGVLFHNGGTGGFKSSLWADPETRRAAVVLINSNQSDPDLLGSWLISGLERDR